MNSIERMVGAQEQSAKIEMVLFYEKKFDY